MSNSESSNKKSLLEFLKDQTKNTFLQEKYPTSNQNLLTFISSMFEKNLTKKQEQEKQLRLAELSIEKQEIDKEIANLQNPEQNNQLTKDQIKSNYFNKLREICIEFLGNENEIIQEIQEAKENLIFENLFKQNKETKIIKEVFSKNELNSKYGLGIASFNSKIWKEIESSEQYKALSNKNEISSKSIKIFAKLRADNQKFKTQIKQNNDNNEKPKTLEELQEEHNQVVNEMNQINKDLETNISSEEAKKIIEKIFLKLSIIQNNYNELSNEEKQKLKVSYKKKLYNQINDNAYYDFLKKFQDKSGNINFIALYFLNPYEFFKKINKIEHSIDFSNSQFREQMILALNKVCEFYGIKNEFKYNLNFIPNDQILPVFILHKLNTFKIADIEILIHISKEIIEDDEKFKECCENSKKYFEEYKKKLNEIINNVPDEIKNCFGENFYKIISQLNKIDGINFVKEFFNLDQEKIKACANFFGEKFNFSDVLFELNKDDINLVREFFKLDKEKIEACAEFGTEGFINLLERLKNLVKEFFNLDQEKIKACAKFGAKGFNDVLCQLNKDDINLVREFFNFDKEKIEACAKFIGEKFNFSNLLFELNKDEINLVREFFELDKQKIGACAKFDPKRFSDVLFRLNKIGGKELVKKFFDLDKEKIEACVEFDSEKFNFNNVLLKLNDIGGINFVKEFFNLNKEKIEACAGFSAKGFENVLGELNKIGGKELVEKFFNIIKKLDNLDEIKNVIKDGFEKNNIEELKKYIENYKLPEPKTELNLRENVKIVSVSSGENFSRINES